MEAKELAKLTISAFKTASEGREAALSKAITEPLSDRIALLEKQLSEQSVPEKGEKGDSVTLDDVLPVIKAHLEGIEIPVPDISELERRVDNAIANIPEVKDGKDGTAPTADEVAKSMEGIFAKWALEFERKADHVLEKAIDRMPKPKDGRDGLEIEDFDIAIAEDGRTVKVSLKRGAAVIEKSVKLSVPIYKDYWKDNNTYEKADMVTHGGSLWLALNETKERPVLGSEDWRMVAKKGGTGKSAYDLAREAGFSGTREQWLDTLGKRQTVKLNKESK